MTFIQFLLGLFYCPVFVISGYALVVHKKLNKELKMLSWWLIITGALHLLSFILWLLHENNLYVLHVLIPVRFLILLIVYKRMLAMYPQNWILLVLGVGFVLYSVTNSLLLEPINTFNSIAMTVESILLIIVAISTYLLLIDKRMIDKLPVSGKSIVWFNGGVFLYYTSSLILMYFGSYIIYWINPQWSSYVWLMHGFFMVILYYCLWRALWNRKTT